MMRTRLSVLCLIVLCIAPALRAQERPATDKFAGIAPKMQEFVDKGEISGIVTLVATKEKVVHLAAVGKSNLETGRKMETGDIFWIASMTKPIVAICIGILKDEGKLSFDDPVAKHLPEFAGQTLTENNSPVKPSRPITLRDVMTHTSGLGEMTRREPHMTLADMSKTLAGTPLRFQPGARWQYSTAGIDILGRVVEVVSGMPFDQFLQKRVLDPVGAKNTSFWVDPSQEQRFAQNYRLNAETNKLEVTTISYLYGTPITDRQRPPLGGAGLFSTAEDIARIYQMMLNNGNAYFDQTARPNTPEKATDAILQRASGVHRLPDLGPNGQRILKPETVAEMTRKQTGDLRARPGMPWGLGFCVVEDPKALEGNLTLSPGSFGHGGAHGTNSWADPTRGIVYVIMLQRGGLRNPDNSDMRIAYQQLASDAMK